MLGLFVQAIGHFEELLREEICNLLGINSSNMFSGNILFCYVGKIQNVLDAESVSQA